jgi:hypothetical protein
MPSIDKGDLLALMKRANELSPQEKNMVLLYAVMGDDHGYVEETATCMAEQMGIAVTTFSKMRKGLVEKGWLVMAKKAANIRYFCLSDEAYGLRTVVRLHA